MITVDGKIVSVNIETRLYPPHSEIYAGGFLIASFQNAEDAKTFCEHIKAVKREYKTDGMRIV